MSSEWLASQLAKFQELKEKREEAAAKNFRAVKQEEIDLKTNPSTRARLERKKAEAEKYLAKEAAKEEGVDFQREQNKTYTIEETERWQQIQEQKEQRKDPGQVDLHQLSYRKCEKAADQIDPNVIKKRNKKEALDHLAQVINEEQRVRSKRSKRRRFDESEDITYINERNQRFNKKASRSYDKYTEDLKESLEKGTAS